LISAA
jgi:hypothetical protein